jgi:hypothetical protein
LSEEELDSLLSRISRTQPVDPSMADDEERVRAALAAMRRSIESGRPASSSFSRHALRRTPRRRRAYRRRWVTVGVAVAVAGVASLVGVESLGAGGGAAGLSLPLAVSPAAAAQLNRAAHAAAGQPTPGDGQWQYQDVRLEGLEHITLPDGPALTYTIVDTQQTWYSPSTGASRELQTQDGISFPSAQDKATYLANQAAFDAAIDGKDPQYPPTKTGLQMNQVVKGNGSPPPWQTSPPSDPQTLLSELWKSDLASLGIKSADNVKAYAVGHKNDDMWMALGDLLNSPIARLRATAYAALSYVPGSKIDGNATDSLGRSGIAVTWMPPFPGNGFTYIISPTTGNLLEKDLIQGHTYGGYQAGSAVIRWVYLQNGVVDSNTALPGGGNQQINAAPTTP